MSWCILRTSSSQTLNLAASLTDAGYEVWAPTELREKRIGKARKVTEQSFAIMPSFVFARMKHLADLLLLSHSPTLNYRVWDSEQRRMVVKGHPAFSVFRSNGQVRPQTDASLTDLRTLEASLQKAAERRREQAKQKGPTPRFKAGQVVKVDGGGFEGLRLTVAEANEGKVVKLIHPDWMWTVEISAWKLRDVQLSQASPEQGTALAA